MKTFKLTQWTMSILVLAGAALYLFSLSSCCEGRDGRDGQAFISLTWVDDEPDYIDAGTSAIPSTFQWGRFYRAYTGYFNLYYEGKVFTGINEARYAWEMDYEVYEIQGERASYCCDGEDGPDTYFTLECSPLGPWYYEDEYYKSTEKENAFKVLSQTDDQVVLQQESGKFGIRVTIRKAE